MGARSRRILDLANTHGVPLREGSGSFPCRHLRSIVEERCLRLPELEPLLELHRPVTYFPVPGMYDGFRYRLESEGVQAKLVSESWCRIAEGSEQRP